MVSAHAGYFYRSSFVDIRIDFSVRAGGLALKRVGEYRKLLVKLGELSLDIIAVGGSGSLNAMTGADQRLEQPGTDH